MSKTNEQVKQELAEQTAKLREEGDPDVMDPEELAANVEEFCLFGPTNSDWELMQIDDIPSEREAVQSTLRKVGALLKEKGLEAIPILKGLEDEYKSQDEKIKSLLDKVDKSRFEDLWWQLLSLSDVYRTRRRVMRMARLEYMASQKGAKPPVRDGQPSEQEVRLALLQARGYTETKLDKMIECYRLMEYEPYRTYDKKARREIGDEIGVDQKTVAEYKTDLKKALDSLNGNEWE